MEVAAGPPGMEVIVTPPGRANVAVGVKVGLFGIDTRGVEVVVEFCDPVGVGEAVTAAPGFAAWAVCVAKI